ncbi:hypothetical protein ACFV4G_36155 [Kitasatospora sp. NPDC059747]|uniref:hypothetical protein n=1 Tax=Kitasatospora sp. NPDC059747 TaxID=3346930 RepID=UPI003663BD64
MPAQGPFSYWSEAARRAVALTARRTDDVEQACRALVAVAEQAGGTREGAERYCRAVRDWIAGSHQWHQANRRFLDVDRDTPPGVRTDRVDELLTPPHGA